ncbi:MAG TPA: bacillithiol biosynthesis cysteine-adding enzyme BshC, partial [Flavobacteriaceae bacterium]|nr:bacillithiol biosynthesis cysteine-adding enzyme BshC [Flavobacteriaceae bacterium]
MTIILKDTMPYDCISLKDSGYFSALICDYLEQKDSIKPLYNRFPTLDNFGLQMAEKELSFSVSNRKILTTILKKQYKSIAISEAVQKNIHLLEDQKTFTITTGHQLNLFTGPLYFLYKIVSTINLCRQLKNRYPKNDFVPVYWMATEDHDFDEINFFNFNSKKLEWHQTSGGAVGELSTTGLDKVLQTFSNQLGTSPNAEKLRKLFSEAYLNNSNLSNATRFLVNELFGDEGLVILDANEPTLKQLFVPYIENELFENSCSQAVAKTNETINSLEEKKYKLQVNPREINLFYLMKGSRERIVEQDGNFYINNSDKRYSAAQMKAEVAKCPERFSPNVLMRPLYQEVILPNLCYIGGGGELAYWLQLKSYFELQNIPFPIVLLRNSAVLISPKQAGKVSRLDLNLRDLFLPKTTLENKITRQLSEIVIDFSQQRK